jgi:hypothetical protein
MSVSADRRSRRRSMKSRLPWHLSQFTTPVPWAHTAGAGHTSIPKTATTDTPTSRRIRIVTTSP